MSVLEKLVAKKKLHHVKNRLKTAVAAGFVVAAAKDVKAANVFEADNFNNGNNTTLDASNEVKKLLERPAGDWKLDDFTIGKECGYDQTAISHDGGYGLYQFSVDTKKRYIKFLGKHPEYKDQYDILKKGLNEGSWLRACRLDNSINAQKDFWYTEYLPKGFGMLKEAMQKAKLPNSVKQMNFMDLHPAVIAVIIDAMNHHGSFCTMVIPAMEENAKDLNSEKFIRSIIKHRLAAHPRFADKIPYKAFKTRLDDLQSFALARINYAPSWQTRYEQGLATGNLYAPLRKYNQQLFSSGKSVEEIRQIITLDTGNKAYQAFAQELKEYDKKQMASESKSSKSGSKKTSKKTSENKTKDVPNKAPKAAKNRVISGADDEYMGNRTVKRGDLNKGPAEGSRIVQRSENLGRPPVEMAKEVRRGNLNKAPNRGYGGR